MIRLSNLLISSTLHHPSSIFSHRGLAFNSIICASYLPLIHISKPSTKRIHTISLQTELLKWKESTLLRYPLESNRYTTHLVSISPLTVRGNALSTATSESRNESESTSTPASSATTPFLVEDEQDKQNSEKRKSLVQRFKETYAVYGKVVIVIHGITSCFWFAGAYALASTGLNLLELFEAAHFPEWICTPLRIGGGAVNTLATTLIVYKLVAPLRYGLTLVLTRYGVRYLRSKGKAPQVQDRDRLRNLARESAKLSQERIKTRLSRSRKKAQRTLASKYRR